MPEPRNEFIGLRITKTLLDEIVEQGKRVHPFFNKSESVIFFIEAGIKAVKEQDEDQQTI